MMMDSQELSNVASKKKTTKVSQKRGTFKLHTFQNSYPVTNFWIFCLPKHLQNSSKKGDDQEGDNDNDAECKTVNVASKKKTGKVSQKTGDVTN